MDCCRSTQGGIASSTRRPGGDPGIVRSGNSILVTQNTRKERNALQNKERHPQSKNTKAWVNSEINGRPFKKERAHFIHFELESTKSRRKQEVSGQQLTEEALLGILACGNHRSNRIGWCSDRPFARKYGRQPFDWPFLSQTSKCSFPRSLGSLRWDYFVFVEVEVEGFEHEDMVGWIGLQVLHCSHVVLWFQGNMLGLSQGAQPKGRTSSREIEKGTFDFPGFFEDRHCFDSENSFVFNNKQRLTFLGSKTMKTRHLKRKPWLSSFWVHLVSPS